MPVSYDAALALVKKHKTELSVADPDEYIENLTKLIGGQPDDRRAAVTIAVGAAQSLITIGVAVFGALAVFILNYRSTHSDLGSSLSVWLLVIAAAVTLLSMWSGYKAIGIAYQRGQRPSGADPSWSTKPLASWLGFQSMSGLVALAFFGAAAFFWQSPPMTKGLSASPVAPGSVAPTCADALVVEGEWTRLEVRSAKTAITLPTSSTGGSSSYLIDRR